MICFTVLHHLLWTVSENVFNCFKRSAVIPEKSIHFIRTYPIHIISWKILQVEIRRFKESVSFSPEELEETISRLNILDGLKRKYGGSIDKVLDYQQKITEEMNQIENVDSIKDKLTRKLSETEKKLAKASSKLSELRKKASDEIERQINMQLKELKFKDANFMVKFYNETNQNKYTVMGVDQIGIPDQYK